MNAVLTTTHGIGSTGESGGGGGGGGGGGWVAVVDDDASIRQALARVLSVSGINARTFASAEQYLAQAGQDEPSCLILDVHLPGLNGFELRDELEARGIAPPILFVSALDEKALHHLSRRADPPCYLQKPFDSRVLLALVGQHLAAGTVSRAG
jgi:FixJ family two-component response regulator